MVKVSEIEQAILTVLDDCVIKLENPRQDGRHFDAVVISAHFKGKSLIEQHRLVMEALKPLFASSLHAMSLKTYTPEEWNERDI